MSSLSFFQRDLTFFVEIQDEYDRFYELLREAYEAGEDLEVVFSDTAVMEKFIDEIIKGKVIHEWLNDMGYGEESVWYSKNERALWLKIFIEKPFEA